MELKGSKTEQRLQSAFIGELQAHARYSHFASAARQAGLEQIADLFFNTARNEEEHAEREFRFLYDCDDVKTNLEFAIERENEESLKFYPEAAEIAKAEGYREIAEFFSRMQKVEAKHKNNFVKALNSLKSGSTHDGRTVSHSAVNLVELMLPHQANPAGFVHGGELMKLMDNTAFLVAARHSRSNVVTAEVESLDFHQPIHVGDMVVVNARMVFAGRSSMVVQIEVDTENLYTGKKIQALTAKYVMVALDPKGKPMHVPPLIISTEEEERLFNQAYSKYKARKGK